MCSRCSKSQEKEPHLLALTDAQYQHPQRRQLDGRLALISDALAGVFGTGGLKPQRETGFIQNFCQKWRGKVNNVEASEIWKVKEMNFKLNRSVVTLKQKAPKNIYVVIGLVV